MTAHGHFHWNELAARDVDKAKDFYGKTLGWTFNDAPMPDGSTYTVAMIGEEMVGGIFKMEGSHFDGMPDHWVAYIAVDDVDMRLELLKAAGGTVMREPYDVEGVGRIAMVADPGGGVQGWMKPAQQG